MKRLMLCLFILAVGLAVTSAYAVDFCVNPGFEDGTGTTAAPWSLWEGTGGAAANPLVNADNPSARCWFNTGGTRNLAAQNNMNLILDTTGNVTYHVKVKYYVPGPLPTGATTASAMVRFHAIGPVADGGIGGLPGDPIVLDDATPAGVVTPGSWVTKEFDWVNTSGCNFGAYLTFRMYSRDAAARVNPAPDVYIDDCQFSSSQYCNDIHGVVQDESGAPIPGATVSLCTSDGVAVETKTTDATGNYAFTRMVPFFNAFYVRSSKTNYNSFDERATVLVSPSAASTTAPVIVLPQFPIARVSGQVFETVNGVRTGIPNVIVTATWGTMQVVSAPTAANGNYSIDVTVGGSWTLSVAPMPAGKVAVSIPQEFIPQDTSALTGYDIQLGPDPDYDVDLLFSTRSSAFTGSSTWPTACPYGGALTTIGAPTTTVLNGQTWETNLRSSMDGFRFPGPGPTLDGQPGSWTDPIPVNGASIVVAVKPVRTGVNDNFQSIVDIFYDRLCLGVRNGDGRVSVRRNSNWGVDWAPAGTELPNGQITVLSLVVQPTGEYKVYANGVQIMDVATNGAFTSLRPNHDGSQPGPGDWGWNGNFTHYINVGRNNPDGWTTFNGGIGDVYVYKTAIADAKRTALEASLTSKYGSAPTFTITSSANAGGTITPVGAVVVPMNVDQSFTIAANYGNMLTDVKVDGTSMGPITTYTFPSVTANHTIQAIFSPLPTISGKVSSASGPIYSARVSISTNADGSNPTEIVSTNALGEYVIAPSSPNGTYYLIAKKGGFVASAVKTVVMSGVSKTNQDFTLVKSATLDPLVVLDASTLTVGTDLASWPNTGSLGGTFDKFAGGVGPNVVANIGGKQAVEFIQPATDGASRRTMVATVPAPGEITGNSDWTMSAVLYRTNSAVNSENAFLCWGGRDWGGWPASQYKSAEFNYRDNVAYVHYGADSGFITVPSEGAWHNVTITYDGSVENIYVDGVFDSTQTHPLNIHPGDMMMVGGAFWNNARGEDQYWRYNGAIASLKIFDQALTPAEIGRENGMIAISGRVLANGTPVAGATVTAVLQPGMAAVGTATSDANGQYSVYVKGNPTDGYYYLSASAAGFTSTGNVEVAVAAADVTGVDIILATAPKLSGIVKDAVSGQPIRNAVVQLTSNGVAGKAIVTDATGAYSIEMQMGTNDVYADALGYAANTVAYPDVQGDFGQQTADIALTPKAETGVIVNGGFEQVVAGKPVGWTSNGTMDWVGVTNTPADVFSGVYSGKYTPAVSNYTAMDQRIPVVPGSSYNVYWKMKGDATAKGAWAYIYFSAADGSIPLELHNNWNGGDVPPATWTQYPIAGPIVRVAAPANATILNVCFYTEDMAPWNGGSIYLDDVVVDRVGSGDPAVPTAVTGLAAVKSAAVGSFVTLASQSTVTWAPLDAGKWRRTGYFYVSEGQGLGGLRIDDAGYYDSVIGTTVTGLTGYVRQTPGGEKYLELAAGNTRFYAGTAIKPLGMNNKAIVSDSKTLATVVRAWGKITVTATDTATGNATAFTLNDGYGTQIPVRASGFALGKTADIDGKTAVITGVVTKDDTGAIIIRLGDVPSIR